MSDDFIVRDRETIKKNLWWAIGVGVLCDVLEDGEVFLLRKPRRGDSYVWHLVISEGDRVLADPLCTTALIHGMAPIIHEILLQDSISAKFRSKCASILMLLQQQQEKEVGRQRPM